MKITKIKLQQALNECDSLTAVLEYLGYSRNSNSTRQIIKKKINELQIDQTQFKINKQIRSQNHSTVRIPSDKIFIENSSYTNRCNIKKRMVDEFNVPYECSSCKIGGEYNGKPISLQLDHINGTPNDNRLENLRLLCPNCHSQTETYSGKKNLTEKPKCKGCGKKIESGSKRCPSCHIKKVHQKNKSTSS